MIGPLRRRHRHVVVFMLLAGPSAFLAGVLSAPHWAKQAVPEALRSVGLGSEFPVQLAATGFPELGDQVQLILLADQAPPRQLAMRIHIQRPLTVPDPLLYWAPGEGLERAILIGPMPTQGTTEVALPRQVKEMYGSLVIYSLGHHSEVARLPLQYGLGGEQ